MPSNKGAFNELLTAAWVNDRFLNVMDGVTQMIDRMLASIYSEGFGPLMAPLTPPDIAKLSEEAFQEMVESQPTLEGKAALLNEAQKLGIPRQLTRST